MTEDAPQVYAISSPSLSGVLSVIITSEKLWDEKKFALVSSMYDTM